MPLNLDSSLEIGSRICQYLCLVQGLKVSKLDMSLQESGREDNFNSQSAACFRISVWEFKTVMYTVDYLILHLKPCQEELMKRFCNDQLTRKRWLAGWANSSRLLIYSISYLSTLHHSELTDSPGRSLCLPTVVILLTHKDLGHRHLHLSLPSPYLNCPALLAQVVYLLQIFRMWKLSQSRSRTA